MTELIIGAIVLLATLFGVYTKGRKDSAAAQDKKRLESVKTAKKVQDDVANLPSDDVDSRLDKWMRDGW